MKKIIAVFSLLLLALVVANQPVAAIENTSESDSSTTDSAPVSSKATIGFSTKNIKGPTIPASPKSTGKTPSSIKKYPATGERLKMSLKLTGLLLLILFLGIMLRRMIKYKKI